MPDEADQKHIYNERTKLLANALDRASTACIAVGLITPVTVFNGTHEENAAILLIKIVVWLFIAGFLHIMARRVLGDLKP